MKTLFFAITLLNSIFANAAQLDCSIYPVDKVTGKEISIETQELLESKGYTMEHDSEKAKFEVWLHSKMKPYNPGHYEFYQFVKGKIDGEEVVSGRTVESKYNGFWDELSDAFKNAFSQEVPLEYVDDCEDLYLGASFEYINDSE